jgi:hypothetical protein
MTEVRWVPILSVVDQKLVLSSYGLLNTKSRTLSPVDWAMLATGTLLWLSRLLSGMPESVYVES